MSVLNIQLIYNRPNGEVVHGDTDVDFAVPSLNEYAKKREYAENFVIGSLSELLRAGEGKLLITLKEKQ